jgi:hypothetical protein
MSAFRIGNLSACTGRTRKFKAFMGLEVRITVSDEITRWRRK